MRSARAKKPTAGVSLFPFLAVLICTMGALIVLLLLVVQQARVQAAGVAREAAPDPAAAAAIAEERQREREDHDWRRETLEKQRGEMTQKLAEERLELGHLDDHIRRLQDQWRRIVKQAEELKRAGQEQSPAPSSVDAEQARLQAQIELAKRELDETRKKLTGKPRSYAIIPYKGPNGTFRRPIYIECRGDAIVFQPEGVVLGPADFEGPLGPGNPFDAALRATREYLATAGAKQGGEPYPLLVVRPDGAVAFALARSAMKSWDDEFGYELIDQEMKLAFPPADEQLAATLQRTLQDARRRQEMLARVAPSRFKGVGAGGGVSGSLASRPTGGPRFGDGLGIGQGSGSASSAGAGTGVGVSSPQNAGSSSGSPFKNPGNGDVVGTQIGGGSGPSSTPSGMFYGGEPPAQSPGQTGSNTLGSDKLGAGRPDKGASSSRKLAADPSGTASGATPTGENSGENNGAGAASSSPAGGSPSGASQGTPSFNVGQPSATGAPASGGEKSAGEARKIRGERRTPGWGLPNSSQNAVGYTRPIRVICSAGRLVILPERGDGNAPRVVPLSPSTPAPIDDFVDAIWKHMDRWGIAGQRAYWKPVLSVQVAPGGEERFTELEAQLQGSGLDVKRK